MSKTDTVSPAPRAKGPRFWTPIRIALVVLPVLAVCIGFGIYAYPKVFPTSDRLRARYTRYGDTKIKASDFAGARAEYEKAAAISPTPPETTYKLALACMGAGEQERGVKLMRELAPLDDKGYLPAYIWLARLVFEAKLKQRTADTEKRRVQTAEAYLKHAIEIEPELTGPKAEAMVMLGEMYALLGRSVEAEKLLTPVADQHPQILLVLADSCKEQGNVDRAKQWAEKAVTIYRDKTTAQPDDHQTRARWALAEAYLDHYEQAETILKDGLARTPDEPILKKAMCDLGCAWFDALWSVPGEVGAARASVLERSLKIDSNYEPLVIRVIKAIKKKGSEAPRYRAILASLREGGKASAFVYKVSGEDAWERGEAEEARTNWEQALKLAPDDMEIANNLAWVLAFGPNPDEPRAIELMNKAIEIEPERISYRDTRGLILVKMKRWKDAEPDLVIATKSSHDRPELHLALAEVYDHINLPEIAEVQRNYAEKGKPKTQPPKP
jgi:tetratricopeptide (TPR) repeat protein